MSEELLPPPRSRHAHSATMDCRGGELVSRLLAATPPYLYAAPLGAHSYFFSEMLRSLVQGREQARSAAAATGQRRTRKRPWIPTRPAPCEWANKKPDNKPHLSEKPLELTTKQPSLLSSHETVHHSTESMMQHPLKINTAEDANVNQISQPVPRTMLSSESTAPSNDLILPPPPPMWYPPLYPPPYGIDPFHFFIDLRVSGHIYDRKKDIGFKSEVPSEFNFDNNASTDKIGQRHGSAFSVPVPKDKTKPINLTHSSKFDEDKVKLERNANTNYVLQNLPRIYENLTEQTEKANENINKMEMDEEKNEADEDEEAKMKRCKDLRALIGLELVVDYCNNKEVKGSNCEPNLEADNNNE